VLASGDTHLGALVSADVAAAADTSLGVGAGVLHCGCGDLLDVAAHVGLDVGADIFHV